MAISKIVSEKRKRNFRYDGKTSQWIAYRVDATVRGKRHRVTFPTKSEAARYLDELRLASAYKKAGLSAPASHTRIIRISELFEMRLRLIANRKERVSARTIFEYFRHSIIGYDIPVRDVTKAHFQQYANARMPHVTNASVNRELTRLRSAFNAAEDIFPVELAGYEPPPIKRVKERKRDGVERRTITETEKDMIVRSMLAFKSTRGPQCPPNTEKVLAAMFEVAWMLGLRYSEILGLQKAGFDANGHRLRIRRFKTRTFSTLEHLPDRVVTLLSEMAAISETTAIFDCRVSHNTYIKRLRRACEANGIPYGRNVEDGVTFHLTRHSFTTRLVQVTDIATAASFTGHSNKEMVAYYSHASNASKEKAMADMYGSSVQDQNERLRGIFDAVRAGKMTLAEFQNAVRDAIKPVGKSAFTAKT